MRGAIVSLDRSEPYGTWRWGGPQWTGRTGAGAPGRLAGITIAVDEPLAVAERWGQVLGVPLRADGGPSLALDGAEVRFEAATAGGGEGLVEIAVEPPPGAPGTGRVSELGGVRLRRLPGG
jgi:hypothetical protein